MAVVEEVSGRRGLDMTRGAKAALLVLAVGITCRLLGAQFDWLVAWPEALTVPMTDWVGAVVGWFLSVFKPVARAFSYLISFPMEWVGAVLGYSPWPLTVGLVTA